MTAAADYLWQLHGGTLDLSLQKFRYFPGKILLYKEHPADRLCVFFLHAVVQPVDDQTEAYALVVADDRLFILVRYFLVL